MSYWGSMRKAVIRFPDGSVGIDEFFLFWGGGSPMPVPMNIFYKILKYTSQYCLHYLYKIAPGIFLDKIKHQG
jgi:hypothetical protein